VFKLKRFSYGTIETPEAWSKRLTSFLIDQGYREVGSDRTMFLKEINGNFMIAQVFGDNILFGGMLDLMVQHLAQEMDTKFGMVLIGEMSYFLGLQVRQMENSTSISQYKYTKSLMGELGTKGAKKKRTPKVIDSKLAKEQELPIEVNQYRSMIGSLVYLTATRPDIAFAVRNCARHRANPNLSHLIQVKRILRYINGTSDYGLLYVHDHNVKLTGYYNRDENVERIARNCSFLGENLISWSTENQNLLNSTSDKCDFTLGTLSKLSWMKQILKEFNVEHDAPTLCCDYLSTINDSRIPIRNNKTNLIEGHHHFSEHGEENIVKLEHITIEEQIAEIFTKALDTKQFEKLRGKLGICLHEKL
jgi:hypothetical protein